MKMNETSPVKIPFRYSREELERVSYVHDWKLPDGRAFSAIFDDCYFPEDNKKDSLDNNIPTTNPLAKKFNTDGISDTQYKNTVNLFQAQIAALKQELVKVYTEMGASDKEIETVLKQVAPGEINKW
jgi:hypothetical protein